MKSEKLLESTIKALQGKLTENTDVDYYREKLKNIQKQYKQIPRNDYRFKNIIKDEKLALVDLKQALASKIGTFVKPLQITNIIKKNLNFNTYSDNTTSIRGFHTGGKGDFKINTDTFKTSLNEKDLYYEIQFYGNENIGDKMRSVEQLLTNEGFDVKPGSNIESLYVSCYKK